MPACERAERTPPRALPVPVRAGPFPAWPWQGPPGTARSSSGTGSRPVQAVPSPACRVPGDGSRRVVSGCGEVTEEPLVFEQAGSRAAAALGKRGLPR